MNLQNQLDTKRTMLDALRGNLAMIEDSQHFKKKSDDDWRVAQLKSNIIECQQQILELEKQLVAMRKGK